MSSIGLFNQSSTLSYAEKTTSGKSFFIDIGKDLFKITNSVAEDKEFDFGLHVFSNVGKELRILLLEQAINKKSDVFKDDFVKEVQKKGFNIIHEIS